MIPPSSDPFPDSEPEPLPDPEEIEQALETGRISPEQARTGFYTRQQAVEETLRGLAEVQPPDPEPSVTSSWQHTVRYASQQQDLNDEGAATAESIISGEASPREIQIWEREAARHPILAAATERAAAMDRALAQLPEVAGVQVPPLILQQLRKTLAAAQAPTPAPAPQLNQWKPWWRKHPIFISMAAGAAAAVTVASLNPTWSLQPSPAIATIVPDQSSPIAAPREVLPEGAPPPPVPEPLPLPLIAQAPETTVPVPAPAPAPEPEPEPPPPPPPPPGSLEALRPVYLAQLTGGITRLNDQEAIARSGEETAIGADLQVTFRSVGSNDLQDTGNEQFAALAAALNDPGLAEEPYFIIEDHSHSDVDVSYRRAQAVCQLLTKYGVKPSRMRPSGKGRFELRPEDVRDGPSSRITIRPASVIMRIRSTGYIDRLGRDFDPMR